MLDGKKYHILPVSVPKAQTGGVVISPGYSGSSGMFITNNPINIASYGKRPFKQNGRGYSMMLKAKPLQKGFTPIINPAIYKP